MRRADQRKIHYIYKISRFDNKYYIGLHSTDSLEDDYFGSGTLLARSIKKYGKDKHSKEILEYCSSREALKLRERELVNKELLEDERCMNLKLGGIGGWDHIADDAINRRAETYSKRYNGQIHRTAANKEKISKGMMGNTNWQIFNLSNPEKCKTVMKNFSNASTSEKAKLKRKNTNIERDFQKGEKNSQFGSCWVTDGIKPIKIKKEFLEEYLNKGYSRGRK